MIKKIAIGLAVLVIAIAVGAYFLLSNIDGLIKSAIETYGTEATQAKVTLGGLKTDLRAGSLELTDLKVGNPSGFNTSEALSLGTVKVTLDTGSLGKNPILVKQVLIQAPKVTYEYAGNGGNLDAIAKNTQSYAQRFSSDQAAAKKDAPPSSGAKDKAAETKLVIEDLTVSQGQIGISHSALQGRTLSSPLPTLHLTNIGKDKGGATPAEVANQVIGRISAEASKVALNDLQKQLGDQLKGAIGNVGGAAGGLGGAADKLKGLLGK